MRKRLLFATFMMAGLMMFSCEDKPIEPQEEEQKKEDDEDKDKEKEPEIEYVLDVDLQELTFIAVGADKQTITVTCENLKWTAGVSDDAADWLEIETRDNVITVSVADNAILETRSSVITITPDVDKVKAKTVTVTQMAYEFDVVINKGKLVLLGDTYGIGAGDYELELGSGDAVISVKGERPYVNVENGYLLLFDVIGDSFTNDDLKNVQLKQGTYNCGMDQDSDAYVAEKMTFTKSFYSEKDQRLYGSRVIKMENGAAVETYRIQAGYFDVELTGKVYKMTFYLTYTDGTKMSIMYKSELDVSQCLYEYRGTFGRDLELLELCEGLAVYYADYYWLGNKDWILSLATKGLYDDAGGLTGTGYRISVELLDAKSGSWAYVSDGEYVLADTKADYTAHIGYVDNKGYMLGCWVYQYEAGKRINSAPLISGMVDLKYNTETKVYTIGVNTVMDDLCVLNGKFEGTLKYEDYSDDWGW